MAEQTKRLRRLPEQGQLAGVCAGLAEYVDIDPTVVRVAFVLLAIITGGGFILVYILLAIVMPTAETPSSKNTDISQNIQTLADDMKSGEKQNRVRNWFGVGLIVLGSWLLIGQLFPGWFERGWDYFWPIALILIGIFVATRRS